MKRALLLMAATILCTNVARAADVGVPVFPKDLAGKNSWELVYQNVQRDLDTGGELEADVYLARFHTDLGQTAFLDIDLGAIDPGGDLGFYGGLGLRYLAYDSAHVRLSPFFQLHYGPGLSSDESGDFDLMDGDAGFLIAGRFAVAPGLELQPYIGPVLSIVRVYADEGDDAEEDQVAGLVGGIALRMPEQHTLRIEAQVRDQVSISVAASLVF